MLAFAMSLSQSSRVDGQSGLGKRVEAFTRPTEQRVKPPADLSSGSAATNACPATRDDMCQKFWAFATHFLNNNKIPSRDRELLTLRTAWLTRGEVIWSLHHNTRFATQAGLTAEDVARVTRGPDAKGWNPFEATLLRAVDELQTSRFVSDATWKALGERYDDRQRLEVVMIVGNYTTLAMFFNSTGAPLAPGNTGFPRN
jgi:alkylhydroperoxidase family enzyme